MYILAAFLLPLDILAPPTPPPPVAAAEVVGLVRGEDGFHLLIAAPGGDVVLLGDADSPQLSRRLALLLDQPLR